MYSMVLLLHSWLRWAALVLGVLALGATATDAGSTRSEKAGLAFMIVMDLQLLLGILLYAFLTSTADGLLNDLAGTMRDSGLRFFAVEHPVAMVAAVVFAHLGRVLARRAPNAAAKRTRILVCFGISILLMLARTPWPGMATDRPLFRI